MMILIKCETQDPALAIPIKTEDDTWRNGIVENHQSRRRKPKVCYKSVVLVDVYNGFVLELPEMT